MVVLVGQKIGPTFVLGDVGKGGGREGGRNIDGGVFKACHMRNNL